MAGEMRAFLGEIRGKKNATGATIPKGYVVKLSAATDDLILAPAAIGDAHYGVTMQDILTGQWGDVQVTGIAVCIAGTGGVVRGDRLTHDSGGTYGRVFTAAPGAGVNNAFVGVANRTAAANAPVEVELAKPGSMLQG